MRTLTRKSAPARESGKKVICTATARARDAEMTGVSNA
jgi:hypothetical protein